MSKSLPALTFILGGSRSGKTRFAQNLFFPDAAVIYWATGSACDSQMKDRIEYHKKNRPRHWKLVEEPADLTAGLKKIGTAGNEGVLLDSLTTWVGHCTAGQKKPLESAQILDQMRKLLQHIQRSKQRWVVVSDEVGMSLISRNALARQFKDVLGDVNQMVAAAADHVFLVVAGVALKIK